MKRTVQCPSTWAPVLVFSTCVIPGLITRYSFLNTCTDTHTLSLLDNIDTMFFYEYADGKIEFHTKELVLSPLSVSVVSIPRTRRMNVFLLSSRVNLFVLSS